ncbi:hypothetical protein [Haladaptatus caseinilyticus]|uniref:hypothetical protein n=1 Tax=Haladaptatus caseinilyticus TaxID=2993314 RepID=UPI00224AAE43|nr:hypothetical protein [Haladaptatus caseinilyticus]
MSVRTTARKPISKTFARDVVIIFVGLLALSWVISGGTTLTYLAFLFASALRNIYFGWIGSGPLFYVVVGIGLLVEALILTVLYRLARRILT